MRGHQLTVGRLVAEIRVERSSTAVQAKLADVLQAKTAGGRICPTTEPAYIILGPAKGT